MPTTFNDSNGPISATRRGQRANGTVAPATARSTSATFGRLRRLEYRTKTPRDKSSVRSDRFGIHTRRLGSFCPVASASYLVHLVLSACERVYDVYVRDSWIGRPAIESDVSRELQGFLLQERRIKRRKQVNVFPSPFFRRKQRDASDLCATIYWSDATRRYVFLENRSVSIIISSTTFRIRDSEVLWCIPLLLLFGLCKQHETKVINGFWAMMTGNHGGTFVNKKC